MSERFFVIGFLLVTCVFLWISFTSYRESKAVEQRIASKRNELARVLQLKDAYLWAKNKAELSSSARKDDRRSFSLAAVEELVSKAFANGKLVMLKPSTLKEQKGSAQSSIEIKVSGAALAEVVSFCNAVEGLGLKVRKFYLTVPQNQNTLDLYAAITER